MINLVYSVFVLCTSVIHVKKYVYVEFIYFLKLRSNSKSTVLCKNHWKFLYLFRNFTNMFTSIVLEMLQEEGSLKEVLIRKKNNLARISVCMASQNMFFCINHSLWS
jgi:hypothetical protein